MTHITCTHNHQPLTELVGMAHKSTRKSAISENPSDCEVWMKALAAKFDGKGQFIKKDWDDLLGNCMAVTDIPCAVRSSS